MPDFIYDTNDLIQVVPNLKVAQTFLLDRFFPNIVTSDTEFVSIDVDVGKRRMAPFVSPLVEGKLVEQRRIQTNTFKPAYIKDKRAPDLRKPVRRMIGERIGGELKGIEREMANLEFEMTDQIDILNRRLEWMAASALRGGSVTIEGEGFETVVVDFGRDADLTVALTGGRQWTPANVTAGTATPCADIEAWQLRILKKSGAKVTDIIFTTSSWAGFIKDETLKGAIVFPAQAPFGNQINPGAQIEQGAIYKGKWGQYDLWVYNDWFVDENDVERPMLTDGDVILSGPNLQGTRAFGQILDPAFNYEALPYAPKTWVENDPAQRILLMQSSPIVIPSRVNASFSANVCPPAED
ncbi:major capsid protein [Bordetella bronchialis]|uniref:Capsid protein n=1 Tax=Bordetella bronchialis TaxID=463025 RepID=A0A193FV38_9BORD|nr:major capsid protein [Bordetella bronchialis]ANN70909.1 capsid protein [Bordetella bronchialis]